MGDHLLVWMVGSMGDWCMVGVGNSVGSIDVCGKWIPVCVLWW
jgi:hypothetical protein